MIGRLLAAPVILVGLFGCGAGSGNDSEQYQSPLQGDFPPDLPRPRYETAEIELRGQRLTVEIADTQERRMYGMMFVSELPADRGMLFVYPTARAMGFWMRNTQIPLDIAYIAEMGKEARIINYHLNMRPFQEAPNYRSMGACRFALEVQGGWLARHEVQKGDLVTIPQEILDSRPEEDVFRPGDLPRRLGGD